MDTLRTTNDYIKLGYSFMPRGEGLVGKNLPPDERQLVRTSKPPFIINFTGTLWWVKKAWFEPVKKPGQRKVERMKVEGSEIQCHGEVRDRGGVIRVWFNAGGCIWEASRINGWIPKKYEGSQTLAKAYKPDSEARKFIVMAARYIDPTLCQ